MPFITQGKTNIRYILIVVILAAIVGGGILVWGYRIQFPEIKRSEVKVEMLESPSNVHIVSGIPRTEPIWIKFKWTNPAEAAKTRIYRSLTKGELGLIRREVASPESEFTDEIEGGYEVYYYTLRSVDKYGNESKNVNQYEVPILKYLWGEEAGRIYTISPDPSDKIYVDVTHGIFFTYPDLTDFGGEYWSLDEEPTAELSNEFLYCDEEPFEFVEKFKIFDTLYSLCKAEEGAAGTRYPSYFALTTRNGKQFVLELAISMPNCSAFGSESDLEFQICEKEQEEGLKKARELLKDILYNLHFLNPDNLRFIIK